MGEPAAGPLDCLPVGCRPPAFCCFGSLGRLGVEGSLGARSKGQKSIDADPSDSSRADCSGRDPSAHSSDLRTSRRLRLQSRRFRFRRHLTGSSLGQTERTIQKCMVDQKRNRRIKRSGDSVLVDQYRPTVLQPNQRNSCTTHSRLSGTTKRFWPTLSRISSVSHSRAVSIFLASITRTDFPSAVDNVYSCT